MNFDEKQRSSNGVTSIQPYPTIEDAMKAVQQHLKRFSLYGSPQPCIVIDLDDTALYTVKDKKNPLQSQSFAILSVKALHEWAFQNGIHTVGITARPYSGDNYQFTLSELKRLGYKLHSVHLMPELKYGHEPSVYDVAHFKALARQRLRQPPYNLWPVVNIGNLPQDLTKLTPSSLYTETVQQLDDRTIYGFMALNEDPMMLNIKLPDEAIIKT